MLGMRREAIDRYGKPIPWARLEAIPWTRFSLEAENQVEGNGRHMAFDGDQRKPVANLLHRFHSA
jgi:hypothetical protein